MRRIRISFAAAAACALALAACGTNGVDNTKVSQMRNDNTVITLATNANGSGFKKIYCPVVDVTLAGGHKKNQDWVTPADLDGPPFVVSVVFNGRADKTDKALLAALQRAQENDAPVNVTVGNRTTACGKYNNAVMNVSFVTK